MPYRRIRRFGRSALRGAGRAALGIAGRLAYNMGRRAVSAVASRFRRKRSRRTFKRGMRRLPRTFLRSIGMSHTKYAVHVNRGTAIMSAADAAADGLVTLGSITLNNARTPLSSAFAGSTAKWDELQSTGYSHMASLYKKYVVVGARLSITVKPKNINTNAELSAGTSAWTWKTNPSMKFGLHVSEQSLATDGFTKWPDLAMMGEKIKTWVPEYQGYSKPLNLSLKWSLRRHLSSTGSLTAYDDYMGSGSTAPTNKVYAHLWNEIADRLSTSWCGSVEVSWSLTQYTKWTDFIGPEADMIPTDVVS